MTDEEMIDGLRRSCMISDNGLDVVADRLESLKDEVRHYREGHEMAKVLSECQKLRDENRALFDGYSQILWLYLRTPRDFSRATAESRQE